MSDMRRKKKVWRSLAERDGALAPAPDENEAIRRSLLELPIEGLSATRRSFLRIAGFGFGGAALAGCTRGPAQKAIPALVPSDVAIPGRSYWIATTCAGCEAGCGALAKCRDGRPVKLEGNPEHPVGAGGLCASGQASVLSLYDSHRLDGPRLRGGRVSWEEADAAVREALSAARARGGCVRLLTATQNGPSTRAAVARFLAANPGARHVTYDALSASAALDAHAVTHGVRALPRLRFERAKVVASFDADFLGTWISPVEFAAGYAKSRRPDEGAMSLHVQFEARMSLTGSRADRRVRLAPWEIRGALESLLALLDRNRAGAGEDAAPSTHGAARPEIARIADELSKARGESLVLCGSNDLASQVLANRANEVLGNYGATLDLEAPSRQRLGDDKALVELRREIESGGVDVLVVQGNPAYDLPDGAAFARSLAGVGLVVSLATHDDETAALAHVVCPEPHFLECWSDHEAVAGVVAVGQPAAPPLRSARTLRESLSRWLGDGREDREIVREHWRASVHPRHEGSLAFDAFFDAALRDGFAIVRPEAVDAASRPAETGVASGDAPAVPNTGEWALVLHPRIGTLDGRHAENPWLQELPDPVTKIVWDNAASLSPRSAAALRVEDGDVVRIELASGGARAAIELPAHVQPGQHDGVVAVALGFGRKGTERFTTIGPKWLEGRPTVGAGETVGRNAAPFLAHDDATGAILGDARRVTVRKTGARRELACTQDHHSLRVPAHLAPKGGEVRDAAIRVTLAELAASGSEALPRNAHAAGGADASLWPDDHATGGTRWGMTIDLADCTGCSACLVSCQAENNVPVVGKDEVRRHREMHWLRVDRYWTDGDGDGDVTAIHQPMMCQHCGNAPCETVCPVLATVHSSDGLNQQVYNRCVGTRYCANNCPYKVRRFNWFDYPREDTLRNMALNPDVTVRSRGVMEKCSLCVQRIVDARAEARREGRDIGDGGVKTACEQSCPTRAITFGDLADKESRVSNAARSPRAYAVLGELGVKPSVLYLAAVRRSDDGKGEPHGRS